ncbi:MAG: c-type cytochrome [Thermoleophilia bacterium]|jgi:cytochrome c peroxidase|nr:c-type cytochrome [Thermoleophilia bacterium]
MRHGRIVAVLAALAVAAIAVVLVARPGGTGAPGAPAASGAPHAPVEWSAGERAAILNAVEAITTGRPEAGLVAEGRRLFRSTTVAKMGESCQGCHTDGGANSDLGLTPHEPPGDAFTGDRDPPTLWRVDRTAPYFWDGRTATLAETVAQTITNHFADGATQAPSVTADQTAAIVAYLRTLDAPEGTFARGTMSAAAIRGEELFQGKAGCVGCHFGPELTDNRIHNVFVPRKGASDTDPGAADPQLAGPAGAGLVCGTPGTSPPPDGVLLAQDLLTCGFNTPTLLGIADSAPYMHNGVLPSLAAVVSFYNANSAIAPLNLTAGERADLVAYLESL